MEMEMFPTEGQLWLGLQGIIPGVTFPALSLILWGTFQKFLHLAAQEAPRVSLGQVSALSLTLSLIQHESHNFWGF